MNKLVIVVSVVLAAALAVSVFANAALYFQIRNESQTTNDLTAQVNSLMQQTGNLTQQINNLMNLQGNGTFNDGNYEAAAYYNEFGLIPATNVNSSFSPPVSMYRALQIALGADGWNKTSLRGMVVGAYLMHGLTGGNNSTLSLLGTGIDGPVTTPPADYSNIYNYTDDVTHLYMWEITVNNASRNVHPPLGFSLVNAASGYILPNPPLF